MTKRYSKILKVGLFFFIKIGFNFTSKIIENNTKLDENKKSKKLNFISTFF